MKIQGIETFTIGTNLSIVRVRTDDSAEGYGQIARYIVHTKRGMRR